LTPATASATNYYVAPQPTGNDVNSGEVSEGARHQWATLKHANEKVKPGDEVFVETGTYNENGLRLTKSGSGLGLLEQVIYHVSYGETATIEGAVQISASYVVLEGFTLRANSGTCLSVEEKEGEGERKAVKGVILVRDTFISCAIQNNAGSGLTVSKAPFGPATAPKIIEKKCTATKTRKRHSQHRARTCANPKHKPKRAQRHKRR
jgi:hypothetical protein